MSLLLSLGLLVLAAAALLHWQRRRQAPAGPDLTLRARLELAPRVGLAVVEFRGEHLVVGWGEPAPRLLTRLAEASGEAGGEA
ncbi:MAG: hypothetical protein P1V51_20800 [Deltaproteobacteria bacterium]|nr:hypothetical protein [Deltaproteobacteria bacterium]